MQILDYYPLFLFYLFIYLFIVSSEVGYLDMAFG